MCSRSFNVIYITFGGFARAIGLIRGDEGWQPWHRQQVSAILGAIAALEREDGGEPTLPYHRIVNAATGEAGQAVGSRKGGRCHG